MVRNIDEFGPIRREIVLQWTAQLKSRGIETAWRQIDDLSAVDLSQQDVSPFSVFPFGPMPIKQLVGHMSFKQATFPAFRNFLIAAVVGAALRVNVAGKRN